jgi:hypothetical protein
LFLAYRQAKNASFVERRGTGLVEFAQYEAQLGKNLARLHHRLEEAEAWFDDIKIGQVWTSPKRSIESSTVDHVTHIGPKALPERRDLEVRIVLTPSVDFLIVEVLFLWEFGPMLDGLLGEQSLGNRLEVKHGKVSPTRANLFQHWQSRYAKFRDEPIRIAREILTRSADSGCLIVSLDFAGYYDNIDPRFLLTQEFLGEVARASDADHVARFKVAAKSLLRAYRSYHASAGRLAAQKVARGIPIGALTSRLVANLALLPLDRLLGSASDIRCYRRYVDDIFIVAERTTGNASAMATDVLRRWLPVRVTPKGADEIQLSSEALPSVPTSLETVAPRYLCTDGRRMVPDACPSHPEIQIELSPL